VQVFTKTQIGSISLAYDGNISNQTALLSKSVSNIGAVNVSVLKGFKGKVRSSSALLPFLLESFLTTDFVPGLLVRRRIEDRRSLFHR
jgi:hypothetical protein